MRPDQIEKLRTLSEKLADVVLDEADPANWPGGSQPLAKISQSERGDRYWCKKNAAASFALLQRTEALLAEGAAGKGTAPTERTGMDAEIAEAEKAAAKALEKARQRSSSIVKRSKASG